MIPNLRKAGSLINGKSVIGIICARGGSKGFPGKNRELILKFAFGEIKSVKMKIKEGLNPTRQILLCLVDNREIPLIGIEQPKALNQIEDEAITIAKHLNVFLETE